MSGRRRPREDNPRAVEDDEDEDEGDPGVYSGAAGGVPPEDFRHVAGARSHRQESQFTGTYQRRGEPFRRRNEDGKPIRMGYLNAEDYRHYRNALNNWERNMRARGGSGYTYMPMFGIVHHDGVRVDPPRQSVTSGRDAHTSSLTSLIDLTSDDDVTRTPRTRRARVGADVICAICQGVIVGSHSYSVPNEEEAEGVRGECVSWNHGGMPHFFHTDCGQRWALVSPKCPLCNKTP